MEKIISKEIVEKFSKNFLNQFHVTSNFFSKYNKSVNDEYLPKAFKGKQASVNAFYSKDRKHIMIVFLKSDRYRFSYKEITGNVFDVFDIRKLWGSFTAFRIENALNVSFKSIGISGARPLDVVGSSEIIIEDFSFDMPYPRNVNVTLDYTMIFSIDKFWEILKQQKQFSNQLALTYIDFYEKKEIKFATQEDDTLDYKEYLNGLKVKMENYFFTKDYKETEIDNFIKQNPDILKYGLGLVNYKSQVILEDVHGDIGQDLKPDLIGYDSIRKVWIIVDYKLPWKKLIRGIKTVRASVTSDITQLKKQLKTYREYFSDKKQRDFVNGKYTLEIKKLPPTIGVIGVVEEHERDVFNEERLDNPGWFTIISYDELYLKVCDYIDLVNKIN